MGVPKTWGPFTGRQLTVIVVAMIVGVVMLPGAVWAVDTFSNVAIQDPVSGVKAKVDSARKLTVGDGVGNLTVDGTVYARPSAAANPFNLQRIAFQDDNFTELTPLTTATIAITDLRIANGTANATQLSIYQYEGASCSSSATYVKGIIGSYYAPAGQTLIESLSTPVVVKPSVPGNSFCLATYASGSTGSGMWLQVNGYTVSGTFAATSARADAKAGPADGPPSRNP